MLTKEHIPFESLMLTKEHIPRCIVFFMGKSYSPFMIHVFSCRHHVYKKTEGGKDIELQEVGPRFEMKSKCVSF